MSEKNDLINNFIKLAEIDSISSEEFRVKKYLKQRFSKMKIKVETDNFGNMFVPCKNAKLLLTAHLDTVEPGRNIKVSIKNGKLISNGTTIVGGDNKAGLSLILTLLENVSKNDRNKMEVLLTVREEQGLQGSKNFEYKKINSKFGISFDKSDQKFGESIVVGANYAEFFEMKFIGKSAHASRPNPSLNPLNLLFDLFSKFKPGFIYKNSTFNIGQISGFKQTNSSPGKLTVIGDIRTTKRTLANKYIGNIKKFIKNHNSKVGVSIKRVVISKGYILSVNDAGYREITASLREQGYSPKLTNVGTITDAVVLSSEKIPTYVFSCGVYNTHKTNEHVVIDELIQAYKFIKYFVTKL